MNNVLQLSFSMICLSDYITAQNNGNINVSLETVFEFNRKDKYNDLKILDDIQMFINSVRSGLLAGSKTKKKHKFRHSSNIVMNADVEDGATSKKGAAKTSRKAKTTKPNPELRTKVKAKTIKERVKALGGQRKKIEDNIEKRTNQRQIKPLVNLFAMIIRSIDDTDLRSLINIAHNETKKFKDRDVRRAMSEGLTILKETPIDSIKDFFTKISHEHHNFSNSPENPYYKLNTAFENFFSELEWILRQMDPDSASLLTVLLHDLEKIFINEIEKTRVKTLSDSNIGVYRKLRKNPYMIEPEDDGIVDIVKDALKTIVKDNYSNLDNNDRNWVKLKPFWENVRKFFETSEERKPITKKHSTTYKKEGSWSAWKSKKKIADSSVSTDSRDVETPPATLTIHITKKMAAITKHSDTQRKIQYEKRRKHSRKTTTTSRIITKKKETDEAPGTIATCLFRNETTIRTSTPRLSKPTKTTIETTHADTEMTAHNKRNRTQIKYKATVTSEKINNKKKQVTSDLSGEGLDIEHDEIEETNKKYSEKQNASMQHRFRVLGGYNKTVTVTRTTLKQAKNFTKEPITQKNVRARAHSHVSHQTDKGKINKTTKIVLLLDSMDPDSYEAGKPSRTTLLPKKSTRPYENVKVYVGARNNKPGKIAMSRRHRLNRARHYNPKIRTDLDTFEDKVDTYEYDKGIESDRKAQERIPKELIKRIYHIEEKIDHIEKLIINEKSSTHTQTIKYNIVRPVSTIKTTTKDLNEKESQRTVTVLTKDSIKTTSTMKSPKIIDEDELTEDNEVDQPTARAHFILQSHLSSAKSNDSVTATANSKKLINSKTSASFAMNTQNGKISGKDGANLITASKNETNFKKVQFVSNKTFNSAE